MKKSQITVGGCYLMKVSGKVVTVRVDAIREIEGLSYGAYSGRRTVRSTTVYECTNLTTGRACRAKSAQAFRGPADLNCPVVAPKGPEAASKPPAGPGPAQAVLKDTERQGSGTTGRSSRRPLINEPVDADGRPTSPASAPAPSAVSSEEPNRPFSSTLEPVPASIAGEHQGSVDPIAPSATGTEEPTLPFADPKSPSAMPTSGSSSCSTSEDAKEGEQRSDPTELATSSSTDELLPQGSSADAAATPSVQQPSAQPTAGERSSPLSAALASNRGKVAGYAPTDEQRAILDAAVKEGLKALVIGAGAGSGKTSQLKMLEVTLPGLGQYTAFSRPLVDESRGKFVRANCATQHGLAFKAVGHKFAHRLKSNRMKSYEVAQRLGIADFEVPMGTDDEGKPVFKHLLAKFLAGQVLVAVNRFCQSADREITTKHFGCVDGIDMPTAQGKRTYSNNDLVKEYLLPFAEKAWADLNDPQGQLPYKPDHYVKTWQLGTGKDAPHIAADYILVDEAQDTAPVFLDVLKQQTHALLVFVGDSNQAIYEWRGAVDAMKAFPGAPRKTLSQSFRFGQAIADVANAVLADLDEPTDLVMRGLESIPSRVAPLANPTCILCRTNAAAISTGLRVSAEGKRVHLIGGGSETVKWVRAAANLIAGRRTEHPDLACFESWTEVQEYSKTDEGGELKLMVKLVDEFTSGAILAWLEAMPAERDADLVVSTAHKSKGREWSTVKLGSDFLPRNKMDDAERRLLYVAATRAKHQLDISECPPFCGKEDKKGEDGKGDGWVPGIPIRHKQPMPSAEQLRDWLAAKAEEQPAAQPQPTPARFTPSPSAPAQPAANGTVRKAEGFTWSKWDGMWCVRGPEGHEGKTVTVVRRNGSTSQERLGTAVQRFAEAWMYRTLG